MDCPPEHFATKNTADLTAFIQLEKDPAKSPLFAQFFLASLTAASLSIASSQQFFTSPVTEFGANITSPQSSVHVVNGRDLIQV